MYLAIELLDRVFLANPKFIDVNENNLTLYQFSCIILASKHDELDENIPLIKDLSRYFTKILPVNRQIPTFNEVIECERELLLFFDWDLMIVIPPHFIRCFLSNGIVFENENILIQN